MSRHDLPALDALGIPTALETVVFLDAIQRIPLGTAVAVEFLGPSPSQPSALTVTAPSPGRLSLSSV